MDKKAFLALLPLFIILSLSLISAYDGYYYPRDNVPKRTTYISDSESYVNYYPWGTEKVSTTTKTTKTTEGYYPNIYYGSYAQAYYPSVPPSNWRYKEPYNCCDYDECWRPYNSWSPCNHYSAYGKPYYYQPRFDSNLGYYNWRY